MGMELFRRIGRMTSPTEQYLLYLEERARHLKTESWFWSYRVWRVLRGYARDRYEGLE